MRRSAHDQPRQNDAQVSSARNLYADAIRLLVYGFLAIAGVIAFSHSLRAGEIEDKFRVSNAASTTVVDNSRWQKLLKTYVKPDSTGLNQVNYAAFKKTGWKSLKTYLHELQAVDPRKLNRNEQFAFWANLYNGKTIEIILAHYPVKSIRDIDISPGLFADGPWKKKVLTVSGVRLSLDDIEHKILRGLFKDPRVHYAVNCASIGCPNLATETFTGARLSKQLDAGARAYINHPRGAHFKDRRLVASKIYKWFDEDFGNSERGVLAHMRKYANAGLAARLKGVTGIYSYEYDWNLNDTRRSGY